MTPSEAKSVVSSTEGTSSLWTLGDYDLPSSFADGLEQFLQDESLGASRPRAQGKAGPRLLSLVGRTSEIAPCPGGGRHSSPARLVRDGADSIREFEAASSVLQPIPKQKVSRAASKQAREPLLSLRMPPLGNSSSIEQVQKSQSSSAGTSETRSGSRNSSQDLHIGRSVFYGNGVVFRGDLLEEIEEMEHERASQASARVECHRAAGAKSRQQAAVWRGVHARELEILKQIRARQLKIGILKHYCSDPKNFPHLGGHSDRLLPTPEPFQELVQPRQTRKWRRRRLEGKAWALHREARRKSMEEQTCALSQQNASSGGNEKSFSHHIVDQHENLGEPLTPRSQHPRSASATGTVEQLVETFVDGGRPGSS